MEQKEPLKLFIFCNKEFVFKEVMDMHINLLHLKYIEKQTLPSKKNIQIMDSLSCSPPPSKFYCKKSSYLTKHTQAVHESVAMNSSKMCPTFGTTLGKKTSISTHMRTRKGSPFDRKPSTDEAPPIGKIHPFGKIAVTLDPEMGKQVVTYRHFFMIFLDFLVNITK